MLTCGATGKAIEIDTRRQLPPMNDTTWRDGGLRFVKSYLYVEKVVYLRGARLGGFFSPFPFLFLSLFFH